MIEYQPPAALTRRDAGATSAISLSVPDSPQSPETKKRPPLDELVSAVSEFALRTLSHECDCLLAWMEHQFLRDFDLYRIKHRNGGSIAPVRRNP